MELKKYVVIQDQITMTTQEVYRAADVESKLSEQSAKITELETANTILRDSSEYKSKLITEENIRMQEQSAQLSEKDALITRQAECIRNISHHLSSLEHSNKRYSEVGKENIALVKIMPEITRMREEINRILGVVE